MCASSVVDVQIHNCWMILDHATTGQRMRLNTNCMAIVQNISLLFLSSNVIQTLLDDDMVGSECFILKPLRKKRTLQTWRRFVLRSHVTAMYAYDLIVKNQATIANCSITLNCLVELLLMSLCMIETCAAFCYLGVDPRFRSLSRVLIKSVKAYCFCRISDLGTTYPYSF